MPLDVAPFSSTQLTQYSHIDSNRYTQCFIYLFLKISNINLLLFHTCSVHSSHSHRHVNQAVYVMWMENLFLAVALNHADAFQQQQKQQHLTTDKEHSQLRECLLKPLRGFHIEYNAEVFFGDKVRMSIGTYAHEHSFTCTHACACTCPLLLTCTLARRTRTSLTFRSFR